MAEETYLVKTIYIETFADTATPLIHAKGTLPTTLEWSFSTAHDNQTDIDIHLLYGTSTRASQDISIGRWRISGIPPAERGKPNISVQFRVDTNGEVSVTANIEGKPLNIHLLTETKEKVSVDIREVSDPKAQHYIFVHRALPSVFYSDPKKFIALLTQDGRGFLHFLWDRVWERELKSNRMAGNRIAAYGLDCEIRKLQDGATLALITLPPPKGMTEAYFVAAVYRPSRRTLFPKQETLARFITLEYGRNLDGSPRTVLCEWTDTHLHDNMGDGPEPTLDAFFEAVCALISG